MIGNKLMLDELEQTLLKARAHVEEIKTNLSKPKPVATLEEFWIAHAELLVAEREVAEKKGEPYAIPLEFPIKWSYGAPLPHLFRSDYQTFLTFLVQEPDPNWDGTYVNVRSPSDELPQPLALVEFHRSRSAKLGSPNDEVFHGHPLSGKGLEAYTAQIVMNSPWIAEIEAMNKVHRMYDSASWLDLKHYIFWFHDTTFECIAKSFSVEVYRENMSQILARICQRLLE